MKFHLKVALLSATVFIAAAGATPSSAHGNPSFAVQLNRRASEVQVVNVRATGGEFRLRFGVGAVGVAETAELKADASAADVQAALNALANVNSDGGSVAVKSFEEGLYVVTFDGGPLANTDVPQLGWSNGSPALSGGLERITILTVFRAEVSRSDESLTYTVSVTNTGDAKTSSGATAEVALPWGLETSVISAGDGGSNWSCTITAASSVVPAKASCMSPREVDPGDTYPLLTVVAKLGADAPGHAVAVVTVSGGGALVSGTGSDEFDFTPARPFGIDSLDTEVDDIEGGDYTQAGGHPFAASLTMSPFGYWDISGDFLPVDLVKRVITDLPRGFVGNALAIPDIDGDGEPDLCPTLTDVLNSTCPAASAVGEINIDVLLNGDINQVMMTIYAIEPEYGAPVQFGFAERSTLKSTYTLTPRLRADDGYAISLDATPIATGPFFRRVNYATLCGFGANLNPEGKFLGCKRASDPTANDVPLITNPTRCTGTPP
ncbi:MAG TPA: hypothetical protein VI039_02225, partial [Solirubrobacterales bacterium]